MEILLNTPTIAEKIFKGNFNEIKGIMEQSRELGMVTFDWSLFHLYNNGHISYEDAIRNADSANELRLNIKLRSTRGEPKTAAGLGLSMSGNKGEDELEAARLKALEIQEVKKRQFEAEQLAKQKQQEQLENSQAPILSQGKPPTSQDWRSAASSQPK